MQKLVVTRSEQVRAVTEALVAATEDGRVDLIAKQIRSDFHVGEFDRASFISGVESALTFTKVENARITGFDVEFSGDTATVSLGVIAQFIGRQEFSGMQPTSWTLTYELTDGEWMLTAVEPRSTPVFPYDDLRQVIP